MAVEQIGLEAVLRDADYQAGVKRYLDGIDKMNRANQSAAGKFRRDWDKLGKSVLKTTSILGVAVVAAAGAATAAVTAFAIDGIKKATDLEAQVSGVAAVLGESAEAVKPLNDLILELGIDPKLKVNATEAADAIELLARNGLSMAEIMDGAARSTVLLANATGADFGTAADISTDAMAIFNIEAANMADAVNGIVSVTTASKFSINDYALALAQGGGVASAVGVEFEDFNTTIAGISPLFKSGSDAGTSFKTFLQRLNADTGPAAKAMEELGLITDETGNQFFDAQGNLKSMNEISILLNDALSGLTEQQRSSALSTIFGSDAMRAAVGVAEQGQVVYTDLEVAAKELGVSIDDLAQFAEGGITAFEALQAQMGQTDAEIAAATRMDNLAGSMEILSGIIDTLKIRIGQAFLPVIRQMVDVFAGFVSTHADAITAAFETIATNVNALINYFKVLAEEGDALNDWLTHMSPSVAAVVANLVGFGQTLNSMLGPAIKFVQDHADAFKGALVGIGVVLGGAALTTAISALGAAIAGLSWPILAIIGAGALLGAAWNTNWLGIRDTTMAVIDTVTTAIQPFIDLFAEFGSGALQEVVAFVTGNETQFGNLTALWEGVKTEAANLFDSIVSAAQNKLLEWGLALWAWRTTAWAWITGAATTASEKVGEWATTIKDKVAEELPGWQEKFTEWGNAAWGWIAGASTTAATELSAFATSMATTIQTGIDGTDWIQVGRNIIAGIKAGIMFTAGLLLEASTTALNVKNKFSGINWTLVGTTALNAIKTGFENVKANVITILGGIATGMSEEFSTIDWANIGSAALEAIQSGFETAKATVLPLLGAVGTSIKEKFTSIDWATVGSTALNAIQSGFETAKATVLPLLETVGTAVKEKFSGIDWNNVGSTALTNIKDGFETAKATVLPLLETVGTSIKEKFSGIDWNNVGKDALTAIKDGFDTAKATVLPLLETVGTSIKEKFTSINWLEVGSSALTEVYNGFIIAKGLILPLLQTVGTDIKDKFTSIDWNQIGQDALTFIKDGFDTAKETVLPLLEAVGTSVKEKFDGVDWAAVGTDALTAIKDGFETTKATVLPILEAVGTSIKDKFTSIDWNAVGKDALTAIKDGFEAAKAAVLPLLEPVFASVREKFDGINWHQSGKDAFNAIKDGFSGTNEALSFEEFSKTATAIADVFKGIDWGAVGKAIWDGIKAYFSFAHGVAEAQGEARYELFKNAANAIANTFKNIDWLGVGQSIWDGIKSFFSGTTQLSYDDWTKVGHGMILALQGAFAITDTVTMGMLTTFKLLVEDVVGKITEVDWKEHGRSVLRGIRDGMEAWKIFLLAKVSSIRTDIKNYFTVDNFVSIGENIIKGIKKGMDNLLESLKEKAKDLANALPGWMKSVLGIESPSKVFAEIGRNIVRGLIGGMDDMEAKLLQTTNRIVDVVVAASQSMTDAWSHFEPGASAADAMTAFSNVIDLMNQTGSGRGFFQNQFEDWQKGLDVQQQLLAIIRQSGARPSDLLGDLDLLSITPETDLTNILMLAGSAAISTARQRMRDELAEMERLVNERAREQMLAPLTNSLRQQGERLADIMQATLDPFQTIRQEQIIADLARFDAQIERVREEFIRTGDASLQRRLDRMASMRSNFVHELEQLAASADVLQVEGNQRGVQTWQSIVNLAQQASDLGINLAERFKGQGFSVGTELNQNALRVLAALQQQVNIDTMAALKEQFHIMQAMQGLTTEFSVSGIGASIAARYQATVLDPLLDKIRQVAAIDDQRAAAIAEYERAAQRIAQLQQEQERLDFVRQQLDLINQVKDAELDPSAIFKGLKFGVDASIADLLEATTRAVQALIGKTEEELQIASPSKVFVRMGRQIMAGLQGGIEQMASGPVLALQRSLVPSGSVTNSRALSVNFGGVTIANGMDQSLFEARVVQVIQGAF